MSDSKLQKYIDRPLKSDSVSRKLFLLTDSKGRYLINYIAKVANVEIYDWQSGRRLIHGFYWLQTNREFMRKSAQTICLAIWLGICDITCKEGSAIVLRHQTDEACCDYIREQIQRYYSFLAWYPKLKVVFLRIPPYSIVRWDQSRGIPITDQIKKDDLVLCHRLALVNDFIDQCNDSPGVHSPIFKLGGGVAK